MEYAPGTKINRAAELDRMGVNRKLLAKRAVESYLQQLLTYGFFHAGRASGEPASHRVTCTRIPKPLQDRPTMGTINSPTWQLYMAKLGRCMCIFCSLFCVSQGVDLDVSFSLRQPRGVFNGIFFYAKYVYNLKDLESPLVQHMSRGC